MTGLDCLREELLKRGFNKAQVTGKLPAAVLDIMANTEHVYSDMVTAERELEMVRLEVKRKSTEYRQREFSLEQAEKKFKDELRETTKYIDKFNAALADCETEEGRDAMRRAQMFVNSVSIDSKYDNTAYIIGLASILSNGKIGPMDELRKMNPALFAEQDIKTDKSKPPY